MYRSPNSADDPPPAGAHLDVRCHPAERRPIPRDGAPERSLERHPRRHLDDVAQAMGLGEATWLGKDALVRTLGHVFRDPCALSCTLASVGTPASLSFLAELVLCSPMRIDVLPWPVRREFVVGPDIGNDPLCGHAFLHTLSLVFIGQWRGAPALYVPEDLRRPYAEALLDLRPAIGDGALRNELASLVRRTVPLGPPSAPGLPTRRARRRLATPGPDRVLELDVRLKDLDAPVSRRILVSYQRSLGALHEIIRIAFAWPQRARHWFFYPARHQTWAPPGRTIGGCETFDEWHTPIRDLLSSRGARALYVIDPPTHWAHAIETRAIHAPGLVEREPRVVDACGARPPPDLHAKRNYSDFIERWARGERHGWGLELTSPDFDPNEAVDVESINGRLAELA